MALFERPTQWPALVLPILTIAWLGCCLYLCLTSNLPYIPALTGLGESVAPSGHFGTILLLTVLVFALIRDRNLDWPTARIALAAGVATTVIGGAIEVIQGFLPTRTSQLGDWLFDGLGAVVGVGLMALVDFKRVQRPRLVAGARVLGAVAVVLTISAVFIWPPLDDATYCPPAVDERRVPIEAVEAGTGSRVTEGLLVLYTFQDSARDVSNASPTLDLELEGSASLNNGGLHMSGDDGVATSTVSATKIHQAVTKNNAFTVEAWVRTRDLLQRGPARIVTSSESSSRDDVNFHLGQERTCLSFRVATGDGEVEWLLTEGVFTTAQPAWHLAVTYDTGSVAVFADGVLVEQSRVEPGRLNSWDQTLPLLVGNEATLDRAFEGDILLVAVYDRALTPAEIARNHLAGPVLSPSD